MDDKGRHGAVADHSPDVVVRTPGTVLELRASAVVTSRRRDVASWRPENWRST
jgi:hypothetical protein